MFISCPFEGAEVPVASAQNGNETNLAATSFEETTAAKSKYLYTNIHLLKFIFFVWFTEAMAEKPLTRTQKDNETNCRFASVEEASNEDILMGINVDEYGEDDGEEYYDPQQHR